MELSLNLSPETNRVLNLDGVTALRQLNLVQGETYGITLIPTGGQSLTGVSDFSFSLREKFDAQNTVTVTSITSGRFVLPLTSVTLSNELAGHDYRILKAYLQYYLSGAEIFEPFLARVAANSSASLSPYVSSVNGQTGDVTVAGGSANVVFTTGNQTISGDKTFAENIIVSGGILYPNGLTCLSTEIGAIYTELGTQAAVFNPSIFGTIGLLDNAEVFSVDAGSRVLLDSQNRYAMDWNSRRLWADSATITLDFKNRQLSGDWQTNTIPTASGHLLNKGYGDSRYLPNTGHVTLNAMDLFATQIANKQILFLNNSDVVGPAIWAKQIAAIQPSSSSNVTSLGALNANLGTYSTPTIGSLYGFGTLASTTAGANNPAGFQFNNGHVTRGNVSGFNGFFFSSRFGLQDSTGTYTTGNASGVRFFVGLTDQTLTNVTTGNDAGGNRAAFSFIRATGAPSGRNDTNFYFTTKDGTTETLTDTLLPFNSGLFQAYIYCPTFPNTGSIYWQIKDIFRDVQTSGIVTATLPTPGTGLRASLGICNVSGNARTVLLHHVYTEV